MQANPESLHMSIMPQHCGRINEIVEALGEALK
jgi:hypothetical protein